HARLELNSVHLHGDPPDVRCHEFYHHVATGYVATAVSGRITLIRIINELFSTVATTIGHREAALLCEDSSQGGHRRCSEKMAGVFPEHHGNPRRPAAYRATVGFYRETYAPI
ncbi:MAG TPA: hypothetical protein VMJ66_01170, partial [Geobacteraceae bacterium]|nr:hypothetical protein [Geobacteraceae bacterium]